MRVALLLLGPVFLFGVANPLHAQVPDDLPERKDFRALRIASTDPKFKNADFRRIEPGATLEFGLGEARYQRWLTETELVDLPPEKILE